jgi:hypothetical protein
MANIFDFRRRKMAMVGTGRANFDVLARPIEADPVRATRLADEQAKAVGEHLAYSLNEIREQLGITQASLAASLGIRSQRLVKRSMGFPRLLHCSVLFVRSGAISNSSSIEPTLPDRRVADCAQVLVISLAAGQSRDASRSRGSARSWRATANGAFGHGSGP